jgi:dTDP-4-amino-4,6-dideoxygalactose transaminase
VTNDSQLAERVRVLRMHGSKPKYHHKVIGGNFRIDALQAAVLSVKLDHLEGWAAARARNADRYRRLLKSTPAITLPRAVYADSGVAGHHVYNQFVIRVPERDRVQDDLNRQDVGTAIYYPVPFHRQECFANVPHDPSRLRHSAQAANETLAIPIYPELSEGQIEWVAECLIRSVHA